MDDRVLMVRVTDGVSNTCKHREQPWRYGVIGMV